MDVEAFPLEAWEQGDELEDADMTVAAANDEHEEDKGREPPAAGDEEAASKSLEIAREAEMAVTNSSAVSVGLVVSSITEENSPAETHLEGGEKVESKPVLVTPATMPAVAEEETVFDVEDEDD